MSEDPCVATESTPLVASKEASADVETGEDDAKTSLAPIPTIYEDVLEILGLALPIFITSFSWVGVSCSQKYNLILNVLH